MNRPFDHGRRVLAHVAYAFVLLSPLGAGCGADEPHANQLDEASGLGSMELPLHAMVSGVEYRVLGTVEIRGGESVRTVVVGPESPPVLREVLNSGSYLVTLLPGWVLERRLRSGFEVIDARLVQNDLSVAVTSNAISRATFVFETTLGGPVDLSRGTLEVGINVRANLMPLPQVADLSAGSSHTCVRFEEGPTQCFGANADGQLGYGHTQDIGDDEPAGAAGYLDLGGLTLSELALGDRHSCARFTTGAVRCWGHNGEGRLGYGDLLDRPLTPAAVPDLSLGIGAVDLSVAASHACAASALGELRCWGAGEHGKLGYGNIANVGDDELPSALPFVTTRVAEIATAWDRTCVRGELRCWGAGTDGRLGYGNTATIGDDESVESMNSVPLSESGVAVQVATGGTHTCVLMYETGNVQCWGSADWGQLGNGNVERIGDDELPADAPTVDLGGRAIQVVAGSVHTCALLESGGVRCWGGGMWGQLGYGNTRSIGDDETPASVGDVPLGGAALKLAAGADHTCALMAGGTVRCWGLGTRGQLGYGDTQSIGDDETPAAAGDVPAY